MKEAITPAIIASADDIGVYNEIFIRSIRAALKSEFTFDAKVFAAIARSGIKRKIFAASPS